MCAVRVLAVCVGICDVSQLPVGRRRNVKLFFASRQQGVEQGIGIGIGASSYIIHYSLKG